MKRVKEILAEIIDWIPRISIVIAIIGPLIIAIRKYVTLDSIDLVLLYISLFGLLLLAISLFIAWRKKRSVKNIPELLLKMDEKMKQLISLAEPREDDLKQFIVDAGELWDIDIQRIQDSFMKKNMSDLQLMIKEAEKRPNPYSQSSAQPFTIVSTFLQSLTGLMITDKVGIDEIKDKEYQKIEKRLSMLQRRLRDSRSIRNIDRYLMWWKGQNHYLLFSHYNNINSVPPFMVPAKAKAALPQFEHLLQIAVNEYLGYVKDSIYGINNKEDDGWKQIEKMN